MFNRKNKRIDLSRAYEKVKGEVFDAGHMAGEEAAELAGHIKAEEKKIVREASAFIGAEEEKIVEAVKEAYDNLPPIRTKRERKRIAKIIKIASPLVIGLLILFLVLAGISFWMLGGIYLEAMAGKGNLEQAVAFVKQGDIESSLSLSRQAEGNFKNALIKADEMDSSVLRYLPLIGPSIKDTKYLLTTANILSRTVTEGVIVSRGIEGLVRKSNTSFSKYSSEEKGKVLAYLYQSGPELAGLKANLDLAALNLEKIKFSFLLFPVKGKIENLKEQIDLGREILERAIPASKFLPELAGYPEKKSFLFLLQNSDELRPTGGFIGNYGIIETLNSDIVRFDTHDSYHLDMPVKDKLNIDPPLPLKNYLVPKWYFRDANWAPDFPQSARLAQWFYKQENGLAPVKDVENFSGIIAITPKFITDLLAITGPITMEGNEYNQENFTELLEYRVEMGYKELGERSWNRKEMVGKIASELKMRLFDLPLSRWPEIFKAISANIEEKNILVYFNDCDLESLAREEGIAGEQKPVEDDYLMVVDANLGSFKTDSVMNRNVNYQVEEKNGGLTAKVTVYYSHQGTSDWRTTNYQTYTRVYVPAGSRLVKAEGFISEVAEGAEEEILASDCGAAAKDKNYFGGLLKIEPGKIGSFSLEYKLPYKVYDQYARGGYSLYLQKQPGNRVSETQVDLKFNKNISAYSPNGFSAEKISANQIVWKTDLNTDKTFQAVLK